MSHIPYVSDDFFDGYVLRHNSTMSIARTDLDSNIAGILRRAGYSTVGDVVGTKPSTLASLRGIGYGRISKIRDHLMIRNSDNPIWTRSYEPRPRSVAPAYPTRSEMIDITVRVPADDYNDFLIDLQSRGSDFETFVRLAIKKYRTKPYRYELTDIIKFGQYDGEVMETIVRQDPKYIKWCVENLNGFELSDQGINLLYSLIDARRQM